MLVKKQNWFKNGKFGQISKFWSDDCTHHSDKNSHQVENGNFGRKLKFWSKIEILVEN